MFILNMEKHGSNRHWCARKFSIYVICLQGEVVYNLIYYIYTEIIKYLFSVHKSGANSYLKYRIVQKPGFILMK